MSRRLKEKMWGAHRPSPAGQNSTTQIEADFELASLLEAATTFEGLQAYQLLDDTPDDEALAYYLVTCHLSRHPVPAALQDVFDRMAARVEADPSLQAQCEQLDRRLAELEACNDAVEQFERLTGHALHPAPESMIIPHSDRSPARAR